MSTNGSISHSWNEETIEAKTLWFSSLTIEERMDLLCFVTDLALIASKRAAGRPVDLEDARLLELSRESESAKETD
jgi:hypothetical protein